MQLPHIVVLGAGFGGLMVTRKLISLLEENEAEVTIVDQNDYHTIVTNLHELAAGTADIEATKVSLSKLSSLQAPFIKCQTRKVKHIDFENKKVLFEDESPDLNYDYLVIGLGSISETFGIPGLSENAFSISSIDGTVKLNQHIKERFSGYKDDPRSSRVTIVVGGAGFTGIEYLGELVDRIPGLCRTYGIPRSALRIINVEAAPAALPGFDPFLVEYAVRYLSKHGITFRFQSMVSEYIDNKVKFKNGDIIETDTMVWTGGVRGVPLMSKLGLKTSRDRVQVNEYLNPPEHDDVFIIGDCSLLHRAGEKENNFYPPTAQLAYQQGFNVGRNLAALIRKQPLEAFDYVHKGTIASLGNYDAVGVVGKDGPKVKGKVAVIFKKIALYRWLYLIGGLSIAFRFGLLLDIRGYRSLKDR